MYAFAKPRCVCQASTLEQRMAWKQLDLERRQICESARKLRAASILSKVFVRAGDGTTWTQHHEAKDARPPGGITFMLDSRG